MTFSIIKYSTQQIIDETTKKIEEIEKKRASDLKDVSYLKHQLYSIYKGREVNFGYIFNGMPEEYEDIDIKDYGHKNLIILETKTKNLIGSYNFYKYQHNQYINASKDKTNDKFDFDKLIKKNNLNLIEEKNNLKAHLDKLNAYKAEVEELIKKCNNIILDE